MVMRANIGFLDSLRYRHVHNYRHVYSYRQVRHHRPCKQTRQKYRDLSVIAINSLLHVGGACSKVASNKVFHRQRFYSLFLVK